MAPYRLDRRCRIMFVIASNPRRSSTEYRRSKLPAVTIGSLSKLRVSPIGAASTLGCVSDTTAKLNEFRL